MSSMEEKACYVRGLRPDVHGNVTMPQDIALLLAEMLIDRAGYERALTDRVNCEAALRGCRVFKEEAETERDATREQNTKLMKAIFAARNCGIFGCCPFCGAGWESSDERHSLTCPVPSAKAALAATDVKP